MGDSSDDAITAPVKQSGNAELISSADSSADAQTSSSANLGADAQTSSSVDPQTVVVETGSRTALNVDERANSSATADRAIRRSERLKIATLSSEIAQAINSSIESSGEFLEHINEVVDKESVLEKLSVLEENNACITHMYQQLQYLCDGEINETISSMYTLFCNDSEATATTLRNNIQQIEQNEIEQQEQESAMEDAKREYDLQVEKFKQLMARRKQRVDGRQTPVASQPQTEHESNVQEINRASVAGLEQDYITPDSEDIYITPTTMREQKRTTIDTKYRERSSEYSADGGINAMRNLAECLVSTIKSTKRSTLEPAVYDGNPATYAEWEMDFDAYVEAEGLTGTEPLRYLKKFVKDEAKSAISGHFITNTQEAYQEARRQLKERFGNRHSVAKALRKRLTDWPHINAKDSKGLREYADFLAHCKSGMRTMPELKILNDSELNEKMVSKLPDWMVTKWARVVKNKRRSECRYPDFAEFVFFVDDEADVMSEPVMMLKGQSKPQRDVKRSHGASTTPTHKSFQISTNKTDDCKFCKRNNHATAECRNLAGKPFREREEFVTKQQLCFGCLKAGHRANQCPEKSTCKTCKKKHPTAMHKTAEDWTKENSSKTEKKMDDSKKSEGTAANNKSVNTTEKEVKQTTPEVTKVAVMATRNQGDLLTMALPIYISSNKGAPETLIYALLDTQSDATFITAEAASAINPKVTRENIIVGTLNHESKETVNQYHDICIRGYNESQSILVTALEWGSLPYDKTQIPNNVNVSKYAHLKATAQKLPPKLDVPVGMLIGINCPEAFAPLEAVLGGAGQPFAQRTLLGWTVVGGKNNKKSKADSNVVKVHVNTAMTNLLANDDAKISQEDIKFLEIMSKQTIKLDNGTYQMPLPFKMRPTLPNNISQAEKRLKQLNNKFQTDSDFKNEYGTFMKDLIKNNHAEEVPENAISETGNVWYIPHFAVKHPKKKKLRVVFDCSALYGNTSINQHLLQGPDLLNSLVGILCRFRKESVAVSCDVEKMYYNFRVAENDRDYLRFLWYDEGGKIKQYRMTVHLFGATSSPAVATYGLRKLAEDNSETLPEAADFINRNFYVDDGIVSTDSPESAIKLIADARELCAAGNLRLHKFVTNDQEVTAAIPESERTVKEVDLFNDSGLTQRTLGLEWSVTDDILKFSSALENKPCTRRGILSVVSQIYDPLGFVAPFTLLGKNVLQKVNQSGIGWDEEIGQELKCLWSKWLVSLPLLEEIQIPRCMKPKQFGNVVRTELHHFSDASFTGIGACSYIRVINEANDVHCSLVMGKARVMPCKGNITIPRLELQGAVVATQLSQMLKNELDMHIDMEYFWTDSMIVLGYLSNEAKRFHVYVANRVSEIRRKTDVSQWHYVPGAENPADIASRGMDCSQLHASMWLEGPEFLKQVDLTKALSKSQHTNRDISLDDPEVRKVKACSTKAKAREIDMYNKFEKFGSFAKLTKAIALLQKMAASKSWKVDSKLETDSLRHAERFLIQLTQKRYYAKDSHDLASGNISKSSNLLKLSPFLDKEGIIRVGGRANKGTLLSYEEKHPIILPKESHLSRLLVIKHHQNSNHLGTTYTLASLRQTGYWIVSGMKLVKEVLSKCVVCKRLKGPAEKQLMGELPNERLTPTPPFVNVGMDCFGHFLVKDRRSEVKRWGILFTCLYSRAIHIELVEDLTTDACINALRCFLAIRGPVRTLICDNGTNFIGTQNELQKQLELMTKKSVQAYLMDKQIEFKMTSPAASHQGGVWERQIRTVRSVLNDILSRYPGRFDTGMLRTAFYEAMSIVNSRPLSVLNINNPEETVITPNHLLTLKSNQVPPPPGDFPEDDKYSTSRWKRVQLFAEEFWKKWKVEYLTNIIKRQKWTTREENLKPGDIVLLVENEKPRNLWRIGSIAEIFPGEDGLVRNVSITLATKWLDNKGKPLEDRQTLRRPIQKVVLLLRGPQKA